VLRFREHRIKTHRRASVKNAGDESLSGRGKKRKESLIVSDRMQMSSSMIEINSGLRDASRIGWREL
jgi:hypothetical protein